jgi:DNA-binding response OmpR family regulator
MYRVLVVDDRISLRETISEYLSQQQLHVMCAGDGQEAFQLCATHTFDCIVLDLMMPKMDGETFIQKLRARSNIPIIVISAKVDEEDTVNVLAMGADDYMTKPLKLKELTARIFAIIRRMGSIQSVVSNLLIQLDSSSRTVTINNSKITLTPTEFAILSLLMSTPGKVYSRRNIFDMIFSGEFVSDRTIDVHIRNLRHKIELDVNQPSFIVTVYGIGYKFRDE